MEIRMFLILTYLTKDKLLEFVYAESDLWNFRQRLDLKTL